MMKIFFTVFMAYEILKNQEDRSAEFLLVKELFSDSAYTPINTMVYQFSEKIKNGEYDYISSIGDARDYWDEWKKALVSFLASKNVLAKKKQHHQAKNK